MTKNDFNEYDVLHQSWHKNFDLYDVPKISPRAIEKPLHNTYQKSVASYMKDKNIHSALIQQHLEREAQNGTLPVEEEMPDERAMGPISESLIDRVSERNY